MSKRLNSNNGMEFNRFYMLKNLESTNRLIHSECVALVLSNFMGKKDAHEFVEKFVEY